MIKKNHQKERKINMDKEFEIIKIECLKKEEIEYKKI